MDYTTNDARSFERFVADGHLQLYVGSAWLRNTWGKNPKQTHHVLVKRLPGHSGGQLTSPGVEHTLFTLSLKEEIGGTLLLLLLLLSLHVNLG